MRSFVFFSVVALAATVSAGPLTIVEKESSTLEHNFVASAPKLVHLVPSITGDLLAPPPRTVQRPSQFMLPPEPLFFASNAVQKQEVAFPERQGFITGHRIPEEVLRRIAEQEADRYVDASAFRARVVEVTTTPAPESPSKFDSFPAFVEDEGLSSERDDTFINSRIPFFVDY